MGIKQASVDRTEYYSKDVKRPEYLSDMEQRKYGEWIIKGGAENASEEDRRRRELAIRKFIESHTALVRCIVYNCVKNSQLREDAIGVGNEELVRKAPDYNYAKGCKFSTFVYPWIKGAVQKFIRTTTQNENVIQSLKYDDGAEGINKIFSIDRKLDVNKVLKKMRAKDSEVICLHHGYLNGPEYTFWEIGCKLGISEEGARKRYQSARKRFIQLWDDQGEADYN